MEAAGKEAANDYLPTEVEFTEAAAGKERTIGEHIVSCIKLPQHSQSHHLVASALSLTNSKVVCWPWLLGGVLAASWPGSGGQLQMHQC